MRANNRKRRATLVFMTAGILCVPELCWPAAMDSLKADFLRGNYRRVIFEGKSRRVDGYTGTAGELDYIMGLSYLKENNLTQAQESFKRVLESPSSKLKEEASLGLADTYLISGRHQEAEDIYRKLLNEKPDSGLRAAILYRLSQSSLKKGDHNQANEYLLKLRKEYPLSPELKLSKNIAAIDPIATESDVYSVQVGFFSSAANANNLRDQLCSLGFPAYIEDAPGGYRVRVGRLKSRDEAVDLESKLSKKGFPTKLCP